MLDENKKINANNYIMNIVEKWQVEFVKKQDDFVISECVKFLKDDDIIRTYKISEEELKKVFMLGLSVYNTRNHKSKIAGKNEIWNHATNSRIIEPDIISRFKNKIEDVCREYGFSISHEDSHGGFIIENYDPYNIRWFKDASINIPDFNIFDNHIPHID